MTAAGAAMGIDEELRLRARIEALNAEYVHTIDEDRLEQWPELFTAGGLYRVVTRENRDLGLPISLIYCDGRGMLADRIVAMRTANIYEPHVYCHTVSALKIVSVADGAIRTQSTFQVIRTMTEGDMSVFACGRYIDRIVEESGRLRFAERIVVLDSRRVDTLLVIPI